MDILSQHSSSTIAGAMNDKVHSASVFSDINSLNGIREQATTDSRSAIKQAAKEFEAFFMNMMLKSMRQASEAMGEDSMFSSPQEKMFIGMLDEQMSVELSQKGNLGIADLMIRNLLGEDSSSKTAGQQPFSIGQGNLLGIKTQPVVKNIDVPDIKVQENIPTINANNLNDSQIVNESPTKVEPTKKPIFEDARNFIEQLAPIAQKVAKRIGVDPRALLAQSALETGWGQYVIHDENNRPSNNLFGIKDGADWKGNSVKIETLEVESGELIKKKDGFRMYSSIEESFNDFVNFLQNSPRYQSVLESANNVRDFTNNLQKAGYATDPNYASKIMRIFNQAIIHNSTAASELGE